MKEQLQDFNVGDRVTLNTYMPGFLSKGKQGIVVGIEGKTLWVTSAPHYPGRHSCHGQTLRSELGEGSGMSKCIFCSESAGLLSSEHKSCRDKANQELEKGRARLDQAILEGRPSKDVIAALKSYRVAGRLDPSINLQKEWLVQADRTALLRSEYKPIDNQAFQEIADLYVYLKPDFLQLGAKMVNWGHHTKRQKSYV